MFNIKKRDKTILIILVIIALAVALYFIIPKLTGKAVAYSCSDSDGGKNYNVQGTAMINEANKGTDYCYNENQVREYSCSERGTLDIEIYDCVDGCEDGACIGSEQEIVELPAEKSWLNDVWLWAGVIVVILIIFMIIKRKK